MKQKDVAVADGGWKASSVRDFSGSPSRRIGEGWMLITAGNVAEDKSNWNTMTASWGALGVLWGRDAAFMFIRPSRHTFAFANENSLFTLSFFDKKYCEALNICGAESGRDIDKAGKTGLNPVVFDGSLADGKAAGAIGFKEASDIIVCRKLYTHDFDPGRFLDPVFIEKNYNGKDYHRLYIGEALTLLHR
ncbi:MAG: flavin reductase family protein [Treponema sp.]|jgi:flavin reductase (DIM6/NTAB) family NADH-FMN oxidoreductase RutF|nr:flavin reductase family protein [Treponema sp.]